MRHYLKPDKFKVERFYLLHKIPGGRSDGQIYIQRGEIRHTNIFSIRLNNMISPKPRGKIKRAHIYTKGDDQTDRYIYYKIEQHDSTKTKGETRRSNIYTKG